MKSLAPLLAIFLCLPLAARADEASHKARAEEIITVLRLDRTVTGVTDNAMRQTDAITAQHYGGSVPPAASVSLAEFQKKLKDVLDPQIGWDVIKPEYIRLIETNFTEEQLEAILAFYKSPAGLALEQKMPGVQQQVGQILQTRVQQLQPQVRQMFLEFQKSLPPATPTPAPGGGSPPAAPASPSTTPKSPQK